MYQIAYYKQFDIKYIQSFDIAKTSISQTWHIPREIQLRGDKVDTIEVQGYDRSNPKRETKDIKSTLYNSLSTPDDIFYVHWFTNHWGIFFLILWQQWLYKLTNKNMMENRSPFELKYQQLKKFESLKVTEKEIIEIEQGIRYKSKDPKWHKVRQKRITASSAGEIAKRLADGSELAERLMTVRHVQTAAMKRGLEFESTAAQKYSKVGYGYRCLFVYICRGH